MGCSSGHTGRSSSYRGWRRHNRSSRTGAAMIGGQVYLTGKPRAFCSGGRGWASVEVSEVNSGSYRKQGRDPTVPSGGAYRLNEVAE